MQNRSILSFALTLISFSLPVSSQNPPAANGQWTWMGGANAVGQPDNCSVLGAASSSNVPGSRQYASSWVDQNGDFWLFGGLAMFGGGVGGTPRNDLWRFSAISGLWTCVQAQSGTSYGTKGLPSETNRPGPRSNAATWADNAGNLWLFGGTGLDSTGSLVGLGFLNDLWMYSTTSGRWTWISGSSLANQLANFGDQGVPSVDSVPGSRESSTTWTDAQNNLWLFGGRGLTSYGYAGPFNELWEFTPGTGMWTWVAGTDQPYGTGNPPPRVNAAGWIDKSGNLWLFGGGNGQSICAPVCGSGNFNDMWRFNPANGQWTWVTGAGIYNPWAQGTYGTLGVPSSSNSPGSRTGSVAWTDSGGHFWLYGGAGQDATAPPGATNYLNDLWEFDPSSSIWTWISGSNVGGSTGNFGVLGVSAPTNMPGGRAYATGWKDENGNLWLFGGQGWNPNPGDANGLFNDLWRFQLGVVPSIPGPPAPPTNSSGQSVAGPSQSSTSKQGEIAEPVSTGSGNYYYSRTDFGLLARGLALVFQRSYNSMDNFAGPLGSNWNHSYNVILTQSSSGIATIRWGDGHGETFTLQGSSYAAQPGVYSTFVANADGTYTLTEKNLTTYNFSAQGKLMSLADRNGNTVQLSYDSSSNLVSVSAAGGRSLSLSYDTNGRILRVTDPMGFVESYSYSAANDLVTSTDPMGGVTTYAYDSNHHVTQITLPNGNTLLQNTYDSQGRAVAQMNGRGFTWQFAYGTPAAGQTTITDARGNKTIHAYDESSRLVGITDANGHTASYSYDSNNNRIGVTNQNGNTTTFSYDINGNLTSILDPLSSTTSFRYDGLNDLVSVVNPKSQKTQFTYDAHGNLLSIQDALNNKTAFAYDSYGEVVSRTDAKGYTAQLSYGSAGDLTGITDAVGNSSSISYNGDGRPVSQTDPNQHQGTIAYDPVGRVTTTSDALGHSTKYVYDAVGNLTARTDANGHKTSYSYDAVNNLLSVTDPLGNTTQYSYDGNNNRITFKNAKGNSTSYQYDVLNRLIRTTDPLSFATAYTYDSVGNVISVTDAKGQTNQYGYDAANRLLSIAYADGKSVLYSYDPDRKRTKMVDSTGTTTYSYDDVDRLTSVVFPGSKTVSYAYDSDGGRSSLTYPDGSTVSYAYDQDERLSSVTDWLSRTTQHSYDPAGNLTKIQYPNHASIGFAYDSANRLTSVVNTTVGVPPLVFAYSMDAVGNRTKITEAGIPTTYSYDADDQLIGASVGPLASTWSYDAVGNRLVQTTPLGRSTYSYDASDRLLKAGTKSFTYDADGNQISLNDSFTHAQSKFTFDAANRLISVAGTQTGQFTYDGDGNRVRQAVGSTVHNYVNDVGIGLPVVLQDTVSGIGTDYVYGGALIAGVRSNGSDFYQFDGLGSVIGLTDISGKAKLAYAYDPFGTSLLPAPPANPFLFTGQALDAGTGLYFLRNRYYDPAQGRFISKDRFSGFAISPQSEEAYVYSKSNPTTWVDPSGLNPLTGLVQFFTDLLGLIPAASNANDVNAQLSNNCGYTGGDFNNCTPQLQQQAQGPGSAPSKAITQVEQVAVSAPETIYGGVDPGIQWVWDKLVSIFTVPVAHATSGATGTGTSQNPVTATDVSPAFATMSSPLPYISMTLPNALTPLSAPASAPGK